MNLLHCILPIKQERKKIGSIQFNHIVRLDKMTCNAKNTLTRKLISLAVIFKKIKLKIKKTKKKKSFKFRQRGLDITAHYSH